MENGYSTIKAGVIILYVCRDYHKDVRLLKTDAEFKEYNKSGFKSNPQDKIYSIMELSRTYSNKTYDIVGRLQQIQINDLNFEKFYQSALKLSDIYSKKSR